MVGDQFGQVSGYDKHNLSLNDWLQSQAGSAGELVKFLEQATLIGDAGPSDPVSQARADLHRAHSVIARTYLVLRLRRDFLLGLSDLMKFRLIPALGYLRIQSESTAILALMVVDPGMSTDWLNPHSGGKFYKRYHSKVVEKMKSLAIYEFYDQGSEMALHSRVHGVIPGLLIDEDATSRGDAVLTYQEFAGPLDFLVWFGIYLRAHQRLLSGIEEGLPEIDLGKLSSSRYGEMVTALLEKIRKEYLKQKQSEPSSILL
jgi:hypothetical protein